MDLKRKVEQAKKAITGIATHDDASAEEITDAMVEISKFVETGADGAYEDREDRIKARADERNAKLAKKREAAKDAD